MAKWTEGIMIPYMLDFRDYLVKNGGTILPLTNEYEMARFRVKSSTGNPETSVIYKRKTGIITFTGDSASVWSAFINNRTLKRAPVPKRAPAQHIKLSSLRSRDHATCFYCLERVEDPEEGSREHLLSVSYNGADHSANIVYAHKLCNQRVGNMSLFEKIKVHTSALLRLHKDQMVPTDEDEIIRQATTILHERLKKPGHVLSNPETVKRFLSVKLSELPNEVFVALFTDSTNTLIAYEEMFQGSVMSSQVFPREVVKLALHHNATGVIFAHNHPGGTTTPSDSDIKTTTKLKQLLAQIDVRVSDHIIVCGHSTYSFSENGLI